MEEVTTEGFVRMAGTNGHLVSTDALKLHTYGVVASIANGEPGLISFDYLNAVRVDTTVAALELTLAGVWSAEPGGYRVTEQETLRVARVVHDQLSRLEELRGR